MVREFDERNMARSRERCAEVEEEADTGKRRLTERERHILDMWPRYEDGELVMVGDRVGYPVEKVGSITILESAFVLCDDAASSVQHERGQCVKRPASKALDADGMEIKVGDMIYSIENGNSYTVRSINGIGTIEFKGFNDKGWSPKYFTHMQPAIDADGVLIKVGDTVWHHSGFAHGVVTSIDAGSLMGTVRYVNGGVEFRDAAKDLTHARPDSWERLEEDAGEDPFRYCKTVGKRLDTFDNAEVFKSADIVRRAKKLAEVGK